LKHLKNRLFIKGIPAIVFLLSALLGDAQVEPINYAVVNKKTFVYKIKDSQQLALDVYAQKRSDSTDKKPCVIFVFGGAFVAGQRDDSVYNNYFNCLVVHDYIVVSISYRLGMRGIKKVSKFHIRPLKNAVDMAADDVYDATNWVITNADKLGIDTSKIILSGSSSGAVTVLEADFYNNNRSTGISVLPDSFHYAGVVSFAGALLSFHGKLKYAHVPAPTMFFHGTADKTVPYTQIKFLNKGLYGSSSVAETFKKNNYPYYIYRAEGLGHEEAVLPMIQQLPLIMDFLDRFVMKRLQLQVDLSYKDPAIKPIMVMSAAQLFKKLQQHNTIAAAGDSK